MSATFPASPRRIRDLPAPPGVPILGNALQIDSTRLHLVAEAWSRKYGEFFRFRIGRRELLVTSNHEAIAAMLRDRPEGFQRNSRLSQTAKQMGFGGLFSSNGEHWRRQRPMVMASFDPAHIKSYFPALVRVTQRFAGRWQRAAAAGAPIDLQADLMRYTVDVTAGLAFGADINTLESDDEVIQKHLDKVLPALFSRLMSPFPALHLLKPRNWSLPRHLRALHLAVDGFIAQARERMARNPSLRTHPTNLIEAMIAARDTEGSGLDDEVVAGNVLTMLLAGEDTTANSLAWMIYLLSRHPDAMRRARDEVRAVIGQDQVPTQYEQIPELRFVEACMHETMRLRPVAPIMINEAVHDTVVAGIEIPKGQLVLCLMRPSATDERHFPNARTFDPDRWLTNGSASKPATSAKRVAMPSAPAPASAPAATSPCSRSRWSSRCCCRISKSKASPRPMAAMFRSTWRSPWRRLDFEC